MADIFVTYLTEMIDDDGLKKLREDEEFSALTQYIPEMGITVFPALVEVSKKYLSLSLQEILFDFSEYYQNYELIEC